MLQGLAFLYSWEGELGVRHTIRGPRTNDTCYRVLFFWLAKTRKDHTLSAQAQLVFLYDYLCYTFCFYLASPTRAESLRFHSSKAASAHNIARLA